MDSKISEVSTTVRQYTSTLLLVDDRPENLLTLECVLEDGNRNFVRATSGNEALKIALQQPLTLIMLDIQMPDMDGLETARLLRLNPRTRHIPILFVSAINPKEKYPLDGFEPGTVDFLFKPLNLVDTRSKVASFENLWMVNQELAALKKTNEKLSKDFDRFVYMVSHDLKTPLRAMTNLAGWIGEDLAGMDNPNVKENLSLLKERVRRVNLMIEGILEYSRAGRITETRIETDTRQLVCGIFESLQPSENFTLNLHGTWPVIAIEKIKLEKIFRHLIQNAFMHHHQDSGQVTLGCSQESGKLVFSVTDDGPGIKPIHYQMIFEMFQTLQPKDEKNSSGTGLPIVKKIIEDQGGTIRVAPNEPEGVTFIFTWPVDAPASNQSGK